MPDTDSSKRPTPPSHARFATTHWTVVLAAGSPDSSRYKEALETLCQTYWFPLYAYLRRNGHNSDNAEDYTQGFFARMLEKEYLRDFDPKPGKFRSFLLTALKHFLANERERANALKRGGGCRFISIDADHAERQYSLEPAHSLSPDKLFEKSWAITVLERTMERLEAELAGQNKLKLFEHLKVYLGNEGESSPYRDAAAGLAMTDQAVKVAVYRLRKRYRDLLRDEIAQTVVTRESIDQEMRDLLNALCY